MIARDEPLRIGVYICHCGSNIAGVIDVEALASLGRGAAPRGSRPALQVHVFRPGAGVGQAGHPGVQSQPHCGGGVFAQPPRTDLPPGGRKCRSQPLPRPDGEHSRAGLVGDRRPRSGLHESAGAPGRRDQPSCQARALAAAVRADPTAGAGGGWRHRRDSSRLDDGRRRQGRHSRRTRSEHRRAHGHVRQDVSHARLRRLHPDAQNDQPSDCIRTSSC